MGAFARFITLNPKEYEFVINKRNEFYDEYLELKTQMANSTELVSDEIKKKFSEAQDQLEDIDNGLISPISLENEIHTWTYIIMLINTLLKQYPTTLIQD